jgi:2-amino-4-hydroxy-6-hydroxymethyldihydropteridine diphosphokinase
VTRCVIALGSNLGDRQSTIADALKAIAEREDIELVDVSSFIETVAITTDGPDEAAPTYLNAVAIIETSHDPHALLGVLNEIEQQFGRVRGERWADRTLDLDIVTYGDAVIDTDDLTVPHPRAAERTFVLQPWLELDPEAVLPGRGRVADLMDVAS